MDKMKRYKLIISYDGTEYQGWQMQTKDKPTIAGTLAKTFTYVFGAQVSILGASRTDAGVHALGQVVRIRTELNIPAEKIMFAWDNALPPDIVIDSLEVAPEGFHPFYNVVQKTYWYHFFLHRPLPFFTRYGYYFRYPVDLDKLQKALNVFVGTQDFRSFASSDDESPNTVRTIESITVEPVQEINGYRIVVHGPSFLRYMIRRIVGAALEVASRKQLSVDCLVQALAEKDPHQPLLPTAPAKGLLLHDIKYQVD